MLVGEYGLAVEQLDHSLGHSGKRDERRNYRLGRERSDVAKRYLDSDLNVVVRVGWSPRQNVAVIRKLLPHEFVELGRESAITIDTETVRRRIGIHQLPVLARDIQVMEGPQKFWNVPSAVWLETFDRFLIGSGKPIYFFFVRGAETRRW
jgi:hypothetical protein